MICCYQVTKIYSSRYGFAIASSAWGPCNFGPFTDLAISVFKEMSMNIVEGSAGQSCAVRQPMKPSRPRARTALPTSTRALPFSGATKPLTVRLGWPPLCPESRPTKPLLCPKCPRRVGGHTLKRSMVGLCATCGLLLGWH